MLNSKKVILILSIVLLVGAGIFWAYNNIYLSNSKTAASPEEIGEANYSDEQTVSYLETKEKVEVPAEIGDADYIYIQGTGGTIKVKNFYKKAMTILEDSQVVISRGDKFNIDFLRTSAEFVVTINEKPLKENLNEAGMFLIEELGIGPSDLCKLAFIISPADTVASVLEKSYLTLPLCSSVLK